MFSIYSGNTAAVCIHGLKVLSLYNRKCSTVLQLAFDGRMMVLHCVKLMNTHCDACSYTSLCVNSVESG